MISEQTTGFCHAAVCRFGNVVALMSERKPEYETKEYLRSKAREIASWVRDGLTIERMTSDEGRRRWDECKCNEPTDE